MQSWIWVKQLFNGQCDFIWVPKNYTILNSLVTPVEEDSTYTISLMTTNKSTGERSEATTVTTYTAS